MRRIGVLVLALCIGAWMSVKAETDLAVPHDSVPENHLEWFGLRGPVKEVVEYDYFDYSKKTWRFDTQGRLTEYIEYIHPFFENGGCVFGLWAHYRYAYDEKGKIQFLETYNANYNTVDDFADLTLELFPPQNKDADFRDKTEKEYGDTTSCYAQWTPKGDEGEDYFGIQYDRYGNMLEDVHMCEGQYVGARVRVRTIQYYKDIDLFDLPVGVKAIVHRWEEDGRHWGNCYDFDREGNMTQFRSWVDSEMLYTWDPSDTGVTGSDLIPQGEGADEGRQVYYWTTVPIAELKFLPEGMNEENAFYLCFDYMGYAFEGSLYPLRNGWWVVLNHWCLDEEETMFLGEDEDGEPIPASSLYKDPFAGMRYPIINTDSISFMTRNYGGQTIKLYESSIGKKVRSKLMKECSMRVLDADPQTRRLFCTTEENVWPVAIGWIDEEWVCANLLTTCP